VAAVHKAVSYSEAGSPSRLDYGARPQRLPFIRCIFLSLRQANGCVTGCRAGEQMCTHSPHCLSPPRVKRASFPSHAPGHACPRLCFVPGRRAVRRSAAHQSTNSADTGCFRNSTTSGGPKRDEKAFQFHRAIVAGAIDEESRRPIHATSDAFPKVRLDSGQKGVCC